LEKLGEIVIARKEDSHYSAVVVDKAKDPIVDVKAWLHSTFEKV
jgi:hypothetical protein